MSRIIGKLSEKTSPSWRSWARDPLEWSIAVSTSILILRR